MDYGTIGSLIVSVAFFVGAVFVGAELVFCGLVFVALAVLREVSIWYDRRRDR